MINEISRNPAGVVPLRPAGEAQGIREPTDSATIRAEATGLESRKQEDAAPVEGEQLSAIVEKLNDFVQMVQRELEFSIDEDNEEVVVKVVDARTKDVVREIPPEEIREMRKRLSEVSEKIFDSGTAASVLFRAKA